MGDGKWKIENVRKIMSKGRWKMGNGFLHKLPQNILNGFV
jgi:hypothetical protein|tara:strand:+ start:1324 stop:1443 length:120 start_codon:yes stop_codon:yes gene_type:complete